MQEHVLGVLGLDGPLNNSGILMGQNRVAACGVDGTAGWYGPRSAGLKVLLFDLLGKYTRLLATLLRHETYALIVMSPASGTDRF